MNLDFQYWALAAIVAFCICSVAQVNPYKDPTPGVAGFRAEVMAEVRIQEDKFSRLAEAIPADRYNWRPSSDARSVSEVFLHVATANYNLPKLIGTPPAGWFRSLKAGKVHDGESEGLEYSQRLIRTRALGNHEDARRRS